MSKNSSLNVRDLLDHIETFAPSSLAEDWDNIGLMVGDYNSNVNRVAICLDAVAQAVIEADKNNCEVLLCHHPLIFRAIKKINVNSEPGKTISEAIKRNITILAAHTNWDKTGVNVTLAELLGLSECKNFDDIGIFGKLNHGLNIADFVNLVKTSWNISKLDIYSQVLPTKISRVALCGGSGAEFWRIAKNFNADIYLTADMKYHELIDATHSGISIGLTDHGEMERASLLKLSDKISECGVQTVLLNVNALTSPFRI